MDQQRRNGQLFKRITVHVRVGNEGVEVDTFSSWGDREETVDELGYEPVVLATAQEVSGHPRQSGKEARQFKDLSVQSGKSLLRNLAHGGWAIAVVLPGRFPETITRCLTRATAGRYHFEEARAQSEPKVNGSRTGVAVFADDFKTIRAFAERDNSNIVHWSEFPDGGHFAATERPDVLVDDLRTFFRRSS